MTAPTPEPISLLIFSFPLCAPSYKQPCQQITCTISNAFISLPLSLPSVLTTWDHELTHSGYTLQEEHCRKNSRYTLQEEQQIINALEAGKAKSDHSPRSEISLKCWALCIKRPRCLCFALGTLQERAEQLCEAAAVPLGTWHSTRQRRPAFSSSRAVGNTGVGLRQMQWWWNEQRFNFFQVSPGYGDASLMPREFAASKGAQEQVSEGFWQRLTVQHVKPVSS